MTDILTVRDHSQPCEHDDRPQMLSGDEITDFAGGAYRTSIGWSCTHPYCHGGQEIKLRRFHGMAEYQYDDGDLLWYIRTGPDERVCVEVLDA